MAQDKWGFVAKNILQLTPASTEDDMKAAFEMLAAGNDDSDSDGEDGDDAEDDDESGEGSIIQIQAEAAARAAEEALRTVGREYGR